MGGEGFDKGGLTVIFSTTLGRMAFLFAFIALGYLLMKMRRVPDNAEKVLSRLENDLFIPALVLRTFMTSFTRETLVSAAGLLGWSLLIEVIVIPVSLLCVRLCAKDRYTQNIFLYGLCFSNFGFMGNAVVEALFPGIFPEYLIFTLVLWMLIYLWGVPSLLMGDDAPTSSRLAGLKNLLNPMFICMPIGMLFGLFSIPVPDFALDLVSAAADCMSPCAMLLTGMTIAKMDLRKLLGMKSVYAVTALRLLVYPLVFIGLYAAVGGALPETYVICAVASLAMPLGLNTIVIPGANGKDTTAASAMALISHTLAVLTIPLIFWLMELV